MLRHFLLAHRDCELSILRGTQNLAGHSSVQSALVNTVLSERIGLDNLPMSLPISVTLIVQEITKPSAWWSFIPACPPQGPQSYANPHQHRTWTRQVQSCTRDCFSAHIYPSTHPQQSIWAPLLLCTPLPIQDIRQWNIISILTTKD